MRTNYCAWEARTVDGVEADLADCAVGSRVPSVAEVTDVSFEAHSALRAVSAVRAHQTLIGDGETRSARKGGIGGKIEADCTRVADCSCVARRTGRTFRRVSA